MGEKLTEADVGKHDNYEKQKAHYSDKTKELCGGGKVTAQ